MPLLLRARGDGWLIEVFGRLPELPPFLKPVPPSAVVVSGPLNSLEIFDPTSDAMHTIDSGDAVSPVFFEAIGYDIHFERVDPGTRITLPASAEARRSRNHNEHHFIDFGSNVGFADIQIDVPSARTSLRIEVFSRKLDFRSDYIEMREDISAILRNLAMTANAKTFGLASPSTDHRPTLVEWFALLKTHFDEFIKLANAISKYPHTGLERRGQWRDVQIVRRVSRQSIGGALRKKNSGPFVHALGTTMPRRIKENISAVSVDTPENRYVKGILQTTYRNMRALSRIKKTNDEDAEHDSEIRFFASIRPTLKSQEKHLESVLRSPLLASIGEGTVVRPKSMVFHKHPTYSRFDYMARILNGGLSFAGNIVPIGVKDTALLYEYWCFLRIVELLRKRFDLREQSIVKLNRFKTTVTLAKGKSAAMRFEHKPTGKPLYVVYNRLFDRLPTISQKPDNVIQLASDDKFYIFDAKYRIQFDRDYLSQYGGPGPTTEDINTMHRYRDAIAIPHPLKPGEYKVGVVIGAAVLFPYPDETSYMRHRFFISLDAVEIGGLPFLPKATSLVEKKIDSLMAVEYPTSPGRP